MKKSVLFVFILMSLSLFGETLKLDLMFTNDIHGGIDSYGATFMNPQFPPTLGGGASAATYIKSVRAKSDKIHRDNLLLDDGDIYQGHPIGTVTRGAAVAKYMNWIGYDLTVPGNHEFDNGVESLKKTYKLLNFPVLSCNIVYKGTDKIVDFVKPYIIVEKLGLKIGIIGVTTTDTKKMSFTKNIEGIDFLPAKPALEKWIKIVRAKGVDLLFVDGHMGIPYNPQTAYDQTYKSDKPVKRYWGYNAIELAHEVKGIDVFFGGHIHKGFKKPWEDPITHTLVLQGYAYGSNVGHLILDIDKDTKTISGYELPSRSDGDLVTLFQDEFIPDSTIGPKINKMQKKAEKGMDEIIGEAGVDLTRDGVDSQNIIGNVVTEAMKTEVGADFAFINLGGIRSDIRRGPVTFRQIFNVMPFDNQIVGIDVDGITLKKIIETRVSHHHHGLRVSGCNVVYSRKRPNFDRITKLLIGGKPWQPHKHYKIVTTDFLLQGNAGLSMLTKIPESQITRYGISLREAISNYFKHHSPVVSQIDDRWQRDDNAPMTPELKKALSEE